MTGTAHSRSKTVLAIVVAGSWISLSEFVRNQFLLKTYWISHYENLGLTFPMEPENGALWGLWSFLFASAIYVLSTKFRLLQTTGIAWVFGFLLMWIVLGNLKVLPLGILLAAVPLSLLETLVAAFILKKMSDKKKEE